MKGLDDEFLAASDAYAPQVPWSIGFHRTEVEVPKDGAVIGRCHVQVLLNTLWEILESVAKSDHPRRSNEPDLQSDPILTRQSPVTSDARFDRLLKTFPARLFCCCLAR